MAYNPWGHKSWTRLSIKEIFKNRDIVNLAIFDVDSHWRAEG